MWRRHGFSAVCRGSGGSVPWSYSSRGGPWGCTPQGSDPILPCSCPLRLCTSAAPAAWAWGGTCRATLLKCGRTAREEQTGSSSLCPRVSAFRETEAETAAGWEGFCGHGKGNKLFSATKSKLLCPENESLELVPPAVGREEQGRARGALPMNGWSPMPSTSPVPGTRWRHSHRAFLLCLTPVCFRCSWFHSQYRCYCQLCPNILLEDAPLWLLALAGNSSGDVRMRIQGQTAPTNT